MAFDITKNLGAQILPQADMPGLRAPFRPEKVERATEPLRTFKEELAAEPANPAQTVANARKPIQEAVDQVRQKVEIPEAKSPKSTLDGIASESPVPSHDLQSLKEFAASHSEEILSSPVASLLAGQLQSVNPTELPQLVGGNQFLADALFGADAEAVMDQAGAPADILASLGVSTELLSELSGRAISDDEEISPAEIFAAVGADTQQMLANLAALRAKLIASASHAMPEAAEKAFDSAGELFAGAAPQMPTKVSKDSLGILSDKEPISGLEMRPKDQSLVDILGISSGVPVAALGAEVTAVMDIATGADKPLPALGSEKLERAERFNEFRSWRDTLQAPVDNKVQARENSRPAEFASNIVRRGESAQPMGQKATFDGFHELGQRIDRLSTENVTKVDMMQVQQPVDQDVQSAAPAPKFMEAVINRFGIAGLSNQITTPSAKVGTNVLGVVQNPNEIAAEMSPDQAMINGKPAELVRNGLAVPQQALSLNPDLATATNNLTRKVTVDELMADVTAGRFNLDLPKLDTDSFGQSSGGDSSPSFTSEKFLQQMAPGLAQTQSFGAEFGAMLGESGPATQIGLTPAERADMAQKVLDSATYLSRQGSGSGSVRLDLSNTNIGPLEIAVSLNDNKVNIKVFTESDPVREAMIADLSRLKEALQTQNVNLNQVEVGVGQRFGSSGSGTFDQNRQFSDQREMREAFADLASFGAGSASNRAQSVEQIARAPRQMNLASSRISSDGQLQIRV